MKILHNSCKYLFFILLNLLFIMCSSESEDSSDNNNSIELIELNNIRQTPIFNTSNSMLLNEIDYPDANLSLLSFSSSNVIGQFGDQNAEEELEIIMEVLRKKTIDENNKKWSSVNYKKGGNYTSLDAVMNKSDYYLTKKNGETLFITKDEKYKINKYLMGSRYVEGFAFSSAGLFNSSSYDFLTLESILEGTIYYTEDGVFSYDESTNIPNYQFVDYRMLLHFRFLIRNGAREVTLKGIKQDGSEMVFNLDSNSDLIALSNEFEANEIEIIWFLAKGDYRVDYFNGIIYSNESDKNGDHLIEYRFGEPFFN